MYLFPPENNVFIIHIDNDFSIPLRAKITPLFNSHSSPMVACGQNSKRQHKGFNSSIGAWRTSRIVMSLKMPCKNSSHFQKLVITLTHPLPHLADRFPARICLRHVSKRKKHNVSLPYNKFWPPNSAEELFHENSPLLIERRDYRLCPC